MQGQSSDFQARAAERLFVAVVNQAILDVLEHGEEAEDAKRWLLSEDFDALQNLFHGAVRILSSLSSSLCGSSCHWPLRYVVLRAVQRSFGSTFPKIAAARTVFAHDVAFSGIGAYGPEESGGPLCPLSSFPSLQLLTSH